MSFSSLLNEISKDKKLKQKITPISNSLSNKKSLKTANSLSHSTTSSTPLPVQKQSFISKYPSSNNIDPSVIRLKEARRKEKERLEALKNAKKPTKILSSNKRPTVSKVKSASIPRQSSPLSSLSSKSRQNSYSSKSNLPNPLPKISAGPKLSFKELMKQAESVDSKQLVINPIKKVQSNPKLEPSRALKAIKISRREFPIKERSYNERSKSSKSLPPLPPPRTPAPQQQRQISNSNKTPTGPKYKRSSTSNNDTSYTNSNMPIGPSLFAKPNSELLNRLSSKKKRIPMSRPIRGSSSNTNRSSLNYSRQNKDDYGIDAIDDDEFSDQGYGNYDYDDYDDDNDGFIVDDEDDYSENRNRDRERRKFENDRRSKEKGYDRNEIWEIFNRGKKRNFDDYHDYDDYDDDMEATGAEILEDEERTLKQAKVDDLREQKLLEKRQLEKKRLLGKKL